MKRKIALISQHASPLAVPGEGGSGGGSIYLARVACELAWMGIQVDVFTCETNPELPAIYEWCENIRVIQVPVVPEASPTDLLHDLREYMQDLFSPQGHAPDLIHAASLQSGRVAAELKTKSGIPFVVSYNATTGMFPGGGFELDQGVIRLADGIIVSSAHEREYLLSWYDADPTYIVEMQHGFDAEISPGDVYEGRSDDMWQSAGRQLAELYEDVLAIRRVTIPGFRIPVLAAGPYEHQNASEVVQQAFEPALQSPAHYFYNEAGMLNLPAELIE